MLSTIPSNAVLPCSFRYEFRADSDISARETIPIKQSNIAHQRRFPHDRNHDNHTRIPFTIAIWTVSWLIRHASSSVMAWWKYAAIVPGQQPASFRAASATSSAIGYPSERRPMINWLAWITRGTSGYQSAVVVVSRPSLSALLASWSIYKPRSKMKCFLQSVSNQSTTSIGGKIIAYDGNSNIAVVLDVLERLEPLQLLCALPRMLFPLFRPFSASSCIFRPATVFALCDSVQSVPRGMECTFLHLQNTRTHAPIIRAALYILRRP